jgi:hypothetical protein
MLEEKRIISLTNTKDKVLTNLKCDVLNLKDLIMAKQTLKKIGALKKVFNNFFDEPVKKAFDAYKSIRDRRNSIILDVEEKESVLKQNIIQYLDENDIQDGEFTRTEGIEFKINMSDFIEGVRNGNVPENLISVNESQLKKEIKTMGDILDIPGITVIKKKFIRLKNDYYQKSLN